ncbi:MAG: hypothetical protein PHU91_03650 [Candidatus Omnitrophica bacterium]|nr:hypothetical protein [Candidatus Omnitrophota bacterium]MDD5236735.1 hypothetical protein [Candidatus Omnitrophota bacterium]MDD5610296.1 hypothetical protein [Candidatus Omnitrophota bacterium]
MFIKKYSLEFILNSKNINQEEVKKSLLDFGEKVEVVDDPVPGEGNLKVHLETLDPATVFDVSAQFGRIGSIRVNEIQT